MKFTKLLAAASFVAIALSCTDGNNETSSADQLSPFAKQYLSMQFGNAALNSLSRNDAAGNIANESFNRLFNTSAAANGRVGEDKDTTIYTDPWYWETCAQITTTENEDKSTTTTSDYGDGCMEGYDPYKYLIFGKYSYTNRYTSEQEGDTYKESFTYNYVNDNFGGAYYYDGDTTNWKTDGYSNYAGTSEYNEKKQAYSGTFTYEHNTTSTWDDIAYVNTGSGKTSYSIKKYTVEERDYTSAQGDEYYYRATVLTPLVIRYDCEYYGPESYGIAPGGCYMMPRFISGREFIRYKQEGKEGSFTIDYGDGTCDNKVTIIENNITISVDLSDQSDVAALTK